jgi:hypothetical protein
MTGKKRNDKRKILNPNTIIGVFKGIDGKMHPTTPENYARYGAQTARPKRAPVPWK